MEEGEERIKVALGVEEPDGFLMKAELSPGQDFKELLERSKAAWQGNEAIGQRGHSCLPGVHRVHHFKLGDASMLDPLPIDFPAEQALRNDARDVTAGPKAGVGDDTHQADIAPPIDEFDALMGQGLPETAGDLTIGRKATMAGAAEDADPSKVRMTWGEHGTHEGLQKAGQGERF